MKPGPKRKEGVRRFPCGKINLSPKREPPPHLSTRQMLQLIANGTTITELSKMEHITLSGVCSRLSVYAKQLGLKKYHLPRLVAEAIRRGLIE